MEAHSGSSNETLQNHLDQISSHLVGPFGHKAQIHRKALQSVFKKRFGAALLGLDVEGNLSLTVNSSALASQLQQSLEGDFGCRVESSGSSSIDQRQILLLATCIMDSRFTYTSSGPYVDVKSSYQVRIYEKERFTPGGSRKGVEPRYSQSGFGLV